jgi:serine/threonine-protein kinase
MPQQFETGRTLLGRYVIDGLLGAGGMGEVYTVHHAELARKRFALKTLRPEVFGLEDIDVRFRREAEVLAALEHPGIVSIVDFGMEAQTPVMVMELLQGDTLRDRLNRTGPLPAREATRIVNEVASALAYTHASNPPIVHRDLKPENLFLVAPDSRVKVLDFGIAKVMGLKTGITQASTALGTPNYMAPEQLRDSATVDSRADQFALASIAYECLTARLAFPGDGIGGVVLAIFDGTRPRVMDVRNDLPPSVDAVLTRAWSADPQNRFADVKAFAQAFADVLEGKPLASDANTVASNRRIAPLNQGEIPPTRPSNGGLVSPAAVSPGTEANPFPATVVAGPPPTTSSRMPIVLGGLVLVAALGGAGVFFATRGVTSPAPPAPTPTPAPVTPVTPTEPSITPTVRPTVEPQIAGNPTAANANAGSGIPGIGGGTPRDVFEVVRDSLTDPVRRCGTDAHAARPVSVRITWNGAIGVPQAIAFDSPPPTPAMRECVSRAIAAYGRIPPQSERTVTHSYRFTM